MIAVVEIAGKQLKVEKNKTIQVPLLRAEQGKKVTFDRVLLLQDNKAIKVGNPVLAGAKVEATVLGEGRQDKVIVFRKKRRKGFKVRRGHRERFTELQITNIVA